MKFRDCELGVVMGPEAETWEWRLNGQRLSIKLLRPKYGRYNDTYMAITTGTNVYLIGPGVYSPREHSGSFWAENVKLILIEPGYRY